MVGYAKGIDVAAEMQAIREAVAKIGAAMQSDPDAVRAFNDATALGELGAQISVEASDFRAWFIAELADHRRIPQTQLAVMLGLSYVRVGQLVRAGRNKGGNPVTDPGSLPVQRPVVLAVVTGTQGVLICHRKDERPPWTFPGGDIEQGEAPAGAAVRRVLAETGLTAKPLVVLGGRIHPRTARHMIYMACTAEDDSAAPVVAPDDEDLDSSAWVGLDTVRARMPDMFEPVRMHLEATLGASELY